MIQEEKRVRFVVVNGLTITEKPTKIGADDAEWYVRALIRISSSTFLYLQYLVLVIVVVGNVRLLIFLHMIYLSFVCELL